MSTCLTIKSSGSNMSGINMNIYKVVELHLHVENES